MAVETDPSNATEPTNQDAGGAAHSVTSTTGVLLIQPETADSAALAGHLESLGHQVVGRAADVQQALDAFLQHQPHAVVLAPPVQGADDPVDLAAKLLAIRRCAIVYVADQPDPATVGRVAGAGVFACLISPAQPQSISAALTVSLFRFAEHERLARENQQLTQTLENRKIIERAKGIYMKHLNLGEPEAHRRLQHESQKRRIPLVDLARKIIESEELLGGGGGGEVP